MTNRTKPRRSNGSPRRSGTTSRTVIRTPIRDFWTGRRKGTRTYIEDRHWDH